MFILDLTFKRRTDRSNTEGCLSLVMNKEEGFPGGHPSKY